MSTPAPSRPIPSTARAVLSAVADAMAAGTEDRDLDLSGAYRQAGGDGPVLAFLATEVEARSGGALTVRPADPALFDSGVQGVNSYLATCPPGLPGETVTETGPGVVLYSAGPYRGGFERAAVASPGAVAEARHRAAVWAEQRRHKNAGTAEVAALLVVLYQATRALLSSLAEDDPAHGTVAYTVRNGEQFFKMEDAAAAASAAGVPFARMLTAAAHRLG